MPSIPIELLRWFVEDSVVLADEDSPFHASITKADPRLSIIVGENASGKSLLIRGVAGKAKREHNITAVTISIRERTEEGFRRAIMFGEEHEHSTGGVSAGVVATGFDQKYDHPWILILDEPEIGLSEGYAEAMGEFIGRRAAEPHENLQGVLLVTHNRALVRGVLRGFQSQPTLVAMQEDPLTIEAWLSLKETRTVDELVNLRKCSWARHGQVEKLLRERSR